jgi:chloramphenicol 3-O-phosphotransferase
VIVLFGGAAGSGKTTIAQMWCHRRSRAVHLELDAIRNLIVSGLVDPQETSDDQALQYEASVRACAALARSFAGDGFDVALDDVFEPEPTLTLWAGELSGLDVRLVILHPSVDAARARESSRGKGVLDRHIRTQHRAVAAWPEPLRIDSTVQTPSETMTAAFGVVERSRLIDFVRDGV